MDKIQLVPAADSKWFSLVFTFIQHTTGLRLFHSFLPSTTHFAQMCDVIYTLYNWRHWGYQLW